ncbi:hypothetical protein, partial [Thiolapillus sp.]|uniref:hypothetical protein n=1 Tax=Thiolapillus sp. TaxID=2017437 RepID=UPI003AF698B9
MLRIGELFEHDDSLDDMVVDDVALLRRQRSFLDTEIIQLKFPRNYSSHHAQQHSDQRISG